MLLVAGAVGAAGLVAAHRQAPATTPPHPGAAPHGAAVVRIAGIGAGPREGLRAVLLTRRPVRAARWTVLDAAGEVVRRGRTRGHPRHVSRPLSSALVIQPGALPAGHYAVRAAGATSALFTVAADATLFAPLAARAAASPTASPDGLLLLAALRDAAPGFGVAAHPMAGRARLLAVRLASRGPRGRRGGRGGPGAPRPGTRRTADSLDAAVAPAGAGGSPTPSRHPAAALRDAAALAIEAQVERVRLPTSAARDRQAAAALLRAGREGPSADVALAEVELARVVAGSARAALGRDAGRALRRTRADGPLTWLAAADLADAPAIPRTARGEGRRRLAGLLRRPRARARRSAFAAAASSQRGRLRAGVVAELAWRAERHPALRKLGREQADLVLGAGDPALALPPTGALASVLFALRATDGSGGPA